MPNSSNPIMPVILERLKKYLATFVVDTPTRNAILQAVANGLSDTYAYGQSIENMYKSGYTGRLTAEDWSIFLSGVETDDQIAAILSQRFQTFQKRGTESGITNELKQLTNDPNATATLLGNGQYGWWADLTYPDGAYTYCDLDLSGLLAVHFTNNSQRTAEEIQSIVRRYLVPLVIQIVHN